jgi:L-malate glycosyltransferase
MRITLFFPNYTRRPFGSHRVLFEYANRLSERGHSVTLVTRGKSRRQQLEVTRARILRHVGDYQLFPWFNLSPEVQVRYVFDKEKWTIPRTDALVLMGWRSERYFWQLRDQAKKVVQLAWAYDSWSIADAERRQIIEQSLTNEHLPIIAGSQFVAALLARMGRDPVAIVCPGVDTAVFRSHRESTDRQSTIGMILRMERPQKGSADGIAALHELRARGHVFDALTVCSDRPGDLPGWIGTRSAADDVSMAEFYNDCTVFLVPSWAEGFGLVALEAMACGAAVVSTENGGVSDFARSGENMLLAPVGDVAAMADQLEVLIANDTLRERIAGFGQATAREFSWEKSTDAFERALTNAP